MDCLKKCVRITKQCMEVSVQVQLFVELLNYYVYFYERGNNNVCVSLHFNHVQKDNCHQKYIEVLIF